jgi:hypothetical protein
MPGGFTLDDFAVADAGTGTCRAGHTARLGAETGRTRQRAATFGTVCAQCPLRQRCTTKNGKILTIRPYHDLHAATRHRAATDPDWQAAYHRWRPPVERVITWIARGGNRRLRYRYSIRNDAWLNTRATAVNLRTLIDLGLHRTDSGWALTEA